MKRAVAKTTRHQLFWETKFGGGLSVVANNGPNHHHHHLAVESWPLQSCFLPSRIIFRPVIKLLFPKFKDDLKENFDNDDDDDGNEEEEQATNNHPKERQLMEFFRRCNIQDLPSLALLRDLSCDGSSYIPPEDIIDLEEGCCPFLATDDTTTDSSSTTKQLQYHLVSIAKYIHVWGGAESFLERLRLATAQQQETPERMAHRKTTAYFLRELRDWVDYYGDQGYVEKKVENPLHFLPKNWNTVKKPSYAAKRLMSRIFNQTDPRRLMFTDTTTRRRECGNGVLELLERFPRLASSTYHCCYCDSRVVSETKMELDHGGGKKKKKKCHPFFLLLWSGFPQDCLEDVHQLYPISLETKKEA